MQKHWNPHYLGNKIYHLLLNGCSCLSWLLYPFYCIVFLPVSWGSQMCLNVCWNSYFCLYTAKFPLSLSFYRLPLTWISLYDFPPLVTFEGLFAFRKWFCFLDLKIKNDWSFHFGYGIFSGKGKKGQYLNGCYFCGIYIIRCQGVNVKPIRWPVCGVVLAVVGGLRYEQRKGPNERNVYI